MRTPSRGGVWGTSPLTIPMHITESVRSQCRSSLSPSLSDSLISRGHGPRGSAVDSARAGTEGETVFFRAAVQLRSNTVPCLRGTRTFQPTVRIAVLQGWRPSPSSNEPVMPECATTIRVQSGKHVAIIAPRVALGHVHALCGLSVLGCFPHCSMCACPLKQATLTHNAHGTLAGIPRWADSQPGHGAAVEVEARGSPALAFAATTCCM
jgi:hypothetical protein